MVTVYLSPAIYKVRIFDLKYPDLMNCRSKINGHHSIDKHKQCIKYCIYFLIHHNVPIINQADLADQLW